MNLSYGIAKTGGVGANDWAFDTDLGIATNSQTNLSITPQKGMVKTTYGTGCFLLMNTGTKPIFSKPTP